jgi:hypothetical protein
LPSFAALLASVIIMSEAPTPLLDAGRYGPGLRPAAIGDLSLFGDGAWASPGAAILSGGSFQNLYEVQFDAPVFHRVGIGAPSLRSDEWSTSAILTAASATYGAFCFSAAKVPRSAEDRYLAVATSSFVQSALICAKFVHGYDAESGQTQYGDPVLTIVHAIAATPDGSSIQAEEVWPDAPLLSPLDWRVPGGPLFPFVGSVAPSCRDFASDSSMRPTRASSLSHMVLAMDGLSAFDVGWSTYSDPVPAAVQSVVLDSLDDLPNDMSARFFGEQRPPALPPGDKAVLVPKFFPLPARSGIPASQLWDPSLGASRFQQSLLEQARGAPAETRTALMWISQFPPLKAWLDAVAANPAQFAIPVVARSSIATSLMPGDPASSRVTALSLSPVTTMMSSSAWMTHVDAVRATCREKLVEHFDLYLQRAAASMGASRSHRPPLRPLAPAEVSPPPSPPSASCKGLARWQVCAP